MADSFIKLDKVVVHVIRMVSFLCLWFSVCVPSDGDGLEAYGSFLVERLTEGETESCSDGRGHVSKSFIQFSADGQNCVPCYLT